MAEYSDRVQQKQRRVERVRAETGCSMPSCLRWAKDLQSLLNDDAGCDLFEKFLTQENCDMSDLFFIYACNGLRLQQDNTVIDKQARAIYKRFIKSSLIQSITEETRSLMESNFMNRQLPIPVDVFDIARKQVMTFILQTTYRNFIQSDLYIEYIQEAMTGGTADRCMDESEFGDDIEENEEEERLNMAYSLAHESGLTDLSQALSTVSIGGNHLPTRNHTVSQHSYSGVKRSPDRIAQPQSIQKQKLQAQRGLKYAEEVSSQATPRPPPNPYHVKGSAFVPPTINNSEIQSVSSGNYADLEYLDTDSESRNPDHRRRVYRDHEKFRADIKTPRDTLGGVVPRTAFPLKTCKIAETQPMKFYEILSHKLQAVAKNRDASNAIVDEQSCQSILDEHVSRVFQSAPVPNADDEGGRPFDDLTYHKVYSDDNNFNSSHFFKHHKTLLAPKKADNNNISAVLSWPKTDTNQTIERWINHTEQESETENGKPKLCDNDKNSVKSGNNKKDESETFFVYQYDGEPVPYIVRIQDTNVCLKQVKDHLIRKGNYRFFCKAACNGSQDGFIEKEVLDDDQILPVWEGKIYTRLVKIGNDDS